MYLISPKLPCIAALPYGLTSNKAIITCLGENIYAGMIYSAIMPMEQRSYNASRVHERLKKEISQIKSVHFWGKGKRKFGSRNVQTFPYVCLNKSSLGYLSNIWESLNQETLPTPNRYKKDIEAIVRNRHYQLYEQLLAEKDQEGYSTPGKKSFLAAVREEAYAQIENGDYTDSEKRIIMKYSLTPLGLYPALAQKIRPSLGHIDARVLYRKFLQSNIHALFLANGFLSYLDRRPLEEKLNLECLWTEPLIADEAKGKKALSLEDYTGYVLGEYYRHNPKIYSFTEPDMKEDVWRATPAFYTVSELPVFKNAEDEKSGEEIPGSNCPVRYCFLGVAFGRKAKYIMHHTRRGSVGWMPHVERSTISALQDSFLEAGLYKTRDDALIRHAIIVSENAKQFEGLLNELERAGKGAETEKHLLTIPYEAVYVVPLNHSGAAELKALMLGSPLTLPGNLRSRILKAGGELFSETSNSLFPLTYHEVQEDGSKKDIPVYVGHLMELNEISHIRKAYRKGVKFVISCYPQQTLYYETIMPGVRFI